MNVEIKVFHDKNEKIELIYLKKRLILKRNKDKTQSSIIITTNSSNVNFCVRQFHPVNSMFWWVYLLFPIAFLQGYLLRYEKQYIDDYFAQINFKLITQNNCKVFLELKKHNTGVFFDKEFYVNIRKDQYHIEKVEGYYFDISIKDFYNCLLQEFKSNVANKFINKWRLVRTLPAIISYGAFVIIPLVYIIKNILNQKLEFIGITSALIILSIALYVLFYIIKKIFSFIPRGRK